MSNFSFEIDSGRENKAPPLNSGMPLRRQMELSTAAADAQAACERWHEELQSVQGQHRARTHELQQMTRLHEQKTSEVNRLLNLEISLNEQLSKINGHRQLLQSRLQEINGRYLQDQGRLEQTQQQLNEWESHKQTVEAQVAAATQQLTGLKAESALLDERSSELSDLLQKAIDEVTRQQERIETARGTVVRHEIRQQELTIDIARLEVCSQQTDTHLKLKQERLIHLEEAGSRTSAHVVDLTSRYQSLEQDFARLTAQCRESEASLNLTRHAVVDERTRLQELRQAVEQTGQVRVGLEHTVSDLTQQRVATSVRLSELQAEEKMQEHALVSLREQRAESQAEMEKLRACEQAAADKLATRRNELARAEEKLGITLNECGEATTLLADLGRTVTELETRETVAEQQFRLFTEEMHELGIKREQVEQQIATTETTLSALDVQHRALSAEIIVLVSTRQTAADALQACRADLVSTEERLQSMQNECQTTEERISSLCQTLQAREEEESVLSDRINVLQQQSQQLEVQTQEQVGRLEILRQERIGAEITQQRLSQQNEEIGIRLEARQVEQDAAAARVQQTLEECRQAEERKTALNHDMENLAVRQQNQEAILREIEAQIARRELERLASVEGARIARQEHETTAANVVTARKELAEQQAGVTETTVKLSELQSTVQTLTTTRASLAGEEQKLVETRSALEAVTQELALAHELKITLETLTSQQAKMAATEQHLGALTRQVEAASERRAQLDTALHDTQQQLAADSARCDTLNQNETETRQRLETMIAQEKDLRLEIATLSAGAQKERGVYDELRSLSKDARQLHEQESAELATQIKGAREQISGWEAQLNALLDWKERLSDCLNRVKDAEPDSPEALKGTDGIHLALSALPHIMDRLNLIKIEAGDLPLSGAPLTGSTTIMGNVSAAFGAMSAQAAKSGMGEIQMNSKLNRLREDIQREETRLNYLRQNNQSLEQRAHIRPRLHPMIQDQESRIRVAKERMSQMEMRMRRAAIEEKNHLEKVASLKEQIAELRGEVQMLTVSAKG
jgi:chromosome segregation ATPase